MELLNIKNYVKERKKLTTAAYEDGTMPMIRITKPIRLIELFAGYGSQAMALERMGIKFEHYKVVEFDKYAVASYNAVHGTEFPTMDITKVHAADLNICDTDKFEYFMTYSFPCTDLSVAGKMKGMKKGSGTKSGLLWEVERILTDINKSGGELPQVLFMENVPQVISDVNIKDFHAWQDFLQSLGYTNYLQVLNAKDYGVAQNRKRCFMFSFLGKYNYKFPAPIPLTKSMKDYLEDSVDEHYYINSEKANKLIMNLIENGNVENKECIDLSTVKTRTIEIVNCVTAKDRSISNQQSVGNGVLQIGNISKEKDFSNPQTGRIYDSSGCAPTLNTCSGGGHEPKTIVAMRGRNPENPSDRTPGSTTEQRLEPNSQGICNALTSVQKDNTVLEKAEYIWGGMQEHQTPRTDCISPSITAACGMGGGQTPILTEKTIKIKQATKEGYIKCKLGGVADLSYPMSKTRRGRVQENGNVSPTITATETGVCRIESLYRIRKLTPRECGRLMDVSDEDITKMEQVNSNSQLYKQFGNSIVVGVMVAMFKNLNIDQR